MATMRSVVAATMGEPSEVLQLQHRPIPEPGPEQVRIRVTAVPVGCGRIACAGAWR
jgi:NADPH:quinone reductase-like Zn-dependent oxidoreductase